LAFHPSLAYASLLVGADKAGGMSVWDVVQRRSRIQVFAPHRWQVRAVPLLASCDLLTFSQTLQCAR